MKIEDRIRHFLRLAEDPGASASEREVAATQAEKLMMKYRIESLPDVDSPREDVQVITVYVKGGHSSLGPMHTIGLSSLAKALSCMAVVQEGSRGSVVTIAGAAGDLALLTELFNSTLTQCNVGLKEALRGRAFYSQSDRFRFRRGYTLGFSVVSLIGCVRPCGMKRWVRRRSWLSWDARRALSNALTRCSRTCA